MTRVKFFQAGSPTIQTSAKFNKFEDSFRLGIPSSSFQKILPFKGRKKQIVLDSNFIAQDESLHNTEVQEEIWNCLLKGVQEMEFFLIL